MSDLIERLESCDFTCEAGPLTMSRDWSALKKRIAKLESELGKCHAASLDQCANELDNLDRIAKLEAVVKRLHRHGNYQREELAAALQPDE